MIMLNDIKNTQSAAQQIVSPASPALNVNHLDDSQQNILFSRALEAFKASTFAKNKIITSWLEAVLDTKNTYPSFVQTRQAIVDKINSWIDNGKVYINPVDVLAKAIEGLTVDPSHNAAIGLLLFNISSGDLTDAQIQDAYAQIGTTCEFQKQITDFLTSNESNAYPNPFFGLKTKIASYVAKAFDAYGIKFTDNIAELQPIKDYLNAFDLTDTTTIDLSNIANEYDLTSLIDKNNLKVSGFNQFIDIKNLEALDTKIATPANGYLTNLDKAIKIANFNITKTEVSKLKTIDEAIKWEDYFKINWNSPTDSNLNLIINGLVPVLAAHSINPRTEIKVTSEPTAGGVNNESEKDITLHFWFVTNPSNPATNILMRDVPIMVRKMISIEQQAKNKINEALSHIKASTNVIHETDLINEHLFADPKAVYDFVSQTAQWKQITFDQFVTFTNGDAASSDEVKKALESLQGIVDKVVTTPYGYQIWMKTDGGNNFQFAITLTGNGKPATYSDAEAIRIAPQAIKVTYESLFSITNSKIASFGLNGTAWAEDFLDVQVQKVADSYITKSTNLENIKQQIREAIHHVVGNTMTDDEIDKRFVIDLSITPSPQTNGQIKYMVHISVTDKVTGEVTTTGTEKSLSLPWQAIQNIKGSVIGDKTSVFAKNQSIGQSLALLMASDETNADFIRVDDGGNAAKGVSIPLKELVVGNSNTTFENLVDMLRAKGAVIINQDYDKFVPYSDLQSIPDLFTYGRYDDVKPEDLGMHLTLRVTSTKIDGSQYSKQVDVFIPLTTHEATDVEKANAYKEVKATGDNAISNLNKYKNEIKIPQEKVDEITQQIQKVVSDYSDSIAPKIPETKLTQLTREAEEAIAQIIKPFAEEAQRFSEQIRQRIEAILGYAVDDKTAEIIYKYKDLFEEFLKTNPSIKDLENMLANPNFLKWMKYLPQGWIAKTMNVLQKASDNYKYGYFGGGVALGLAGFASGAAAISTGLAAKKTAKHSNAIKIRGHKLITIVTSAISLATLGGAAALMIYFFTQQGGF